MAKSSKGAAFEREICRKLSLWWTQHLPIPRDDIFWRTSCSGGRATSRHKKGKRTSNSYGDIMAVDSIGLPFLSVCTLELKRGYSRATIADLLDKPETGAMQVYEKWFEQAKESQRLANTKYWMVVAKRNQRDPIVFMPKEMRFLMDIDYPSPYLQLRFVDADNKETIVIGLKLEVFLKHVSPKTIIEQCSNP